MTASIDNKYGRIGISASVFALLAGMAASSCYGVVGMANRSVADGFVSLLRRDALDKGILVKLSDQTVHIEMHIMVEYGVNIPVICNSITNNVRYAIESATEFEVASVRVCVDAIRVG